MGESAEFEKLTMLEGRLAAALDRIAVGVGEAQARFTAPVDDPGVTSAAMEDAVLRADSAEAQLAEVSERVAALESQLEQTQTALAEAEAGQMPEEGAADVDLAELLRERDHLAEERNVMAQRVQALEAAREADRDEMNRQIAAMEEEIAGLKGELQEAADAKAALETQLAEAPETAAEPQSEEATAAREEIEALNSKINRLTAERAEARAERDDLREKLDEMQDTDGGGDQVMQLRAEVQELRISNERLARNIDRLRSGVTDPDKLNRTLVVELAALKAARASEAAELDRILSDLAPILEQGGANA